MSLFGFDFFLSCSLVSDCLVHMTAESTSRLAFSEACWTVEAGLHLIVETHYRQQWERKPSTFTQVKHWFKYLVLGIGHI